MTNWQKGVATYKFTEKNKMKTNINDLLSPAGAEVSIIPVISGDQSLKINDEELPEQLPVLALRNAVIFPGTIFPITIGREKSIRLVEAAQKGNLFIGTVPQINVSDEDPDTVQDLSEFGTVAKIIKTFEMPDGTISAVLQGFRRFHLDELIAVEPYLVGRVHYLPEIEPEQADKDISIIVDSLKEKAAVIIKSSSFAPKEAVTALKSIDDFQFLVNFIATTIELENLAEKIELLGFSDLKERAMKLLAALDKQVEILYIKR